MIIIGNNLKELRTINNMSQEELALLLNVSNKTISHWETDYSQPSLTQLQELKIVFKTSYDDLLE